MEVYSQESPVVWGLLGETIWDGEDSIKKTLGRAFITLPVLQNTIVEVEVVLSDRPLTHLPSAASHLLCRSWIVSVPHPTVSDEELTDPDYLQSAN